MKRIGDAIRRSTDELFDIGYTYIESQYCLSNVFINMYYDGEDRVYIHPENIGFADDKKDIYNKFIKSHFCAEVIAKK